MELATSYQYDEYDDYETSTAMLNEELRRNSCLAMSMIVQAAMDVLLPVTLKGDEPAWKIGEIERNQRSRRLALRWLKNETGLTFSLADACDFISSRMESIGINVDIDPDVVGAKIIANAKNVAVLDRAGFSRQGSELSDECFEQSLILGLGEGLM